MFTIELSIKLPGWQRFSQTLLAKPRKHDVTPTSFMPDLSKLARFPVVRMCQIDDRGVTENLETIPSDFGGHPGKTGEGKK